MMEKVHASNLDIRSVFDTYFLHYTMDVEKIMWKGPIVI